ncbi:MAG: hypothetical protein KAJ24_06520, partial [Candidatus Aenigmarchaeota archaeon]|nr:hypothetical protein [Candidatus Aenigmarchaeota archaeon]
TVSIGMLLGYPACCTKHYMSVNKKYDIASTPYFLWDRVLHSYWNTKGTPSFYLNKIYFGEPYYLIFHFPCSYDCKKSIAIAKKTLALMESEDPLFAQKIVSRLKLPALYSAYSTLFFKGQVFHGNKILYSGVYECTRPGITSWFDLVAFRKGNLVEILKGKIKIFRDQQLINELNMPEKFVLFNGEKKNSESCIANALS